MAWVSHGTRDTDSEFHASATQHGMRLISKGFQDTHAVWDGCFCHATHMSPEVMTRRPEVRGTKRVGACHGGWMILSDVMRVNVRGKTRRQHRGDDQRDLSVKGRTTGIEPIMALGRYGKAGMERATYARYRAVSISWRRSSSNKARRFFCATRAARLMLPWFCSINCSR